MDKVKFSIDGDQVCALLGENLQEGEAEFELISPSYTQSIILKVCSRLLKNLEDRFECFLFMDTDSLKEVLDKYERKESGAVGIG